MTLDEITGELERYVQTAQQASPQSSTYGNGLMSEGSEMRAARAALEILRQRQSYSGQALPQAPLTPFVPVF